MEVNRSAAAELAAYLEEHGISQAAFGRSVGVQPSAVLYWLRRVTVPSEPLKRAIQKQTKGAIKASAWPVVDRRGRRSAAG